MPITINGRKFSIIRKAEFNEYQVTVVENNCRLDNLTYYTNDLEDARGSIRAMIMEYAFKVCEKGTFGVVHR